MLRVEGTALPRRLAPKARKSNGMFEELVPKS